MDKVNLNCFHSTYAMFSLLVLNLQIQTVPAQRLECICAGFAPVQFKSVAEFAHKGRVQNDIDTDLRPVRFSENKIILT